MIKEECEKCGIDFLSTPFDKSAVDFLESIGADAYKIASFELVDIPLIEYAAAKGKPMVISCGMGSLEEIQDAVNACRKMNNNQIVLLKCCSEYPTNWEDMHLGNIPDMKNRFGTMVGLSDHSLGSIGAIVGVTLGACVVEKHIKLEGVESADSEFSMNIEKFAAMVRDIKTAKSIAQGPIYDLSEKETASKVFRRSVFAVEDIPAEGEFTENNIRIIRPSNGLPPKYYDTVLGSRSARNIKKGEPISWDVINDVCVDNADSRFELRMAEEGDMRLLYTWANDPQVRKNAFHSEIIPFEDHKAWFTRLMDDSSQRQYIFVKDGNPIGQIRFSVSNEEAEIDYSIAPEKRGLGYGKKMLELAKERFHQDCPSIKILVGKVKKSNQSSENCFKNSGFEELFHQYEFYYEE